MTTFYDYIWPSSSASKIPKNPFQQKLPFEKRKHLALSIKNMHPERIPVVLKNPTQSREALLCKEKFLVPDYLTVGEFHIKIKDQMESGISSKSKSFFLLTESQNSLVVSELMSAVYARYQNEDGFLYLYFCEENIFG